jgi:hypothetical protein
LPLFAPLKCLLDGPVRVDAVLHEAVIDAAGTREEEGGAEAQLYAGAAPGPGVVVVVE